MKTTISSTHVSSTTEDQLRSYVQNQRLSLSFVEVEDRHGFRILRNILKDINDTFDTTTVKSTGVDGTPFSTPLASISTTTPSIASIQSFWSILQLLNQLITLPTNEAYECSLLPLPHPPTLRIPPPANLEPFILSCQYPSLLAECTCTSTLFLAHTLSPPSFTSPLRSNQAYRTDNALANAIDTSTATNTYGLVKPIEGALLSWCNQTILIMETIRNLFQFLYTAKSSILAPYRNILKYLQNTNNASKYSIAEQFILQLFINLAPFRMYTAWNQPVTYQLSEEIFQLLVQNYSTVSSSPFSSLSFTQELSVCLVDMFPELLDYCRQRSIQNKWKEEKENIHIRYVTMWLITHIQHPHLSLPVLQQCLPMTLRICDDWDAHNIWLGISALIHILRNSNPTDLRHYKELIKDILQRLFTSARHPLLMHSVSYVYALMGPTLFGVCPAYDTLSTGTMNTASLSGSSNENYLQRILRTGTGGTSTFGKTGVTIGPFDGPYDLFLQDIFRSLSMVNSSHLQYSLLSNLNILCLQMKEYNARHLQFMVPILCKLITESYDSRVICTAVHILRSLMIAIPERFTLPSSLLFNTAVSSSTEDLSADTLAIQNLIDLILTTLFDAYQQNRGGKYILPVVNDEGILSYPGASSSSSTESAGRDDFKPSPSAAAIEIIDTNAQTIVQQYLQYLFKDLLQKNSSYIVSVCTVLASSTNDPELRTCLRDLAVLYRPNKE